MTEKTKKVDKSTLLIIFVAVALALCYIQIVLFVAGIFLVVCIVLYLTVKKFRVYINTKIMKFKSLFKKKTEVTK